MTVDPNCRRKLFSHSIQKATPDGNNRKHTTRPVGANQNPRTIRFGMDLDTQSKEYHHFVPNPETPSSPLWPP